MPPPNQHQNRPQVQQQNRPQQPQAPAIQQTVAAGTPATPEPETNTAELGNQAPIPEVNGTHVRELTVSEEFQFKVAGTIGEIWIGTATPFAAKQSIQSWWQSQSAEFKAEHRQEFIEIGRHLVRQAEEIVNELPLLLM